MTKNMGVQLAHNRQYALPVGGLRGWAINDLRSAHSDAADSSTTHLRASGNRHYRVLGSAIRVGTGKARQLLDRSVLSANASTIFVVVTFRRAE